MALSDFLKKFTVNVEEKKKPTPTYQIPNAEGATNRTAKYLADKLTSVVSKLPPVQSYAKSQGQNRPFVEVYKEDLKEKSRKNLAGSPQEILAERQRLEMKGLAGNLTIQAATNVAMRKAGDLAMGFTGDVNPGGGLGKAKALSKADDALGQSKPKTIRERPVDLSDTDMGATYRPTVATPETFQKKEVMNKAKAIYDEKVSKLRDSKEILQQRRLFIRETQKHFGLTDPELRFISKKDIRLMTNVEFKGFLDDVRVQSETIAETRQARNELVQQITNKNLNVEPLRESLKLPPIAKMKTSELRQLDETLTKYQKDDVFLPKRKLETVHRTELDGIRTYREVREKLAQKMGVKVEELNNIKVAELDRFRGEAGLAERNPFYKMMVGDTASARLAKEAEYLEIEKTALGLAKNIKTTLTEKFIPQQKNIRAWFEATDKSTIQLTKEESALVRFMQDEWSKARDYLIAEKAMNKGIKSENYFTHIRRGTLEAIKEDGFVQAFKEILDNWKMDEQAFNILDTQTGDVLALDKFFKFAMRRTGELKPTENIVGAFLTYMKTFKTKQALDELVPLIDTYAHALTPKGLTKEGLLLHGNLTRFVKEWLNTQKGRNITLLAKQGGKIDIGLRVMKSFTTIFDLALNVPVSIAAQVGEQAVQFKLLGLGKFIKAKARAITPRGKRITAKYRNLIGKNPWTELIEPMKSVGDRFNQGLFIAFRDANVRRNRNFLLGSLTKEEWLTETLSPKRLADLRIEVGRYGVMDGAKSIIGATPEAGAVLQYKTWAVPILTAEMRNIKYMTRYALTAGKENPELAKRALVETIRSLEILLPTVFVGAYVLDDKDESFAGKLKMRMYQEALTLYGAVNPTMWLNKPRIFAFLGDVGENLMKLVKFERYEESKFGEYEAGDLKGIEGFERQFTPRALKQFKGVPKKQLEDVNKEILEDIESGRLTIAAAKEKYVNELQKLEAANKKTRLAMKPEEYKANLVSLIESGDMEVAEAKEEFIEYSEKNVESFSSDSEKGFISRVALYAKAIGTDPVTAAIFLFEGETIRRIDNRTIIVERMPLEESEKIRTERGAGKEFRLDHIIPLQLGGSNDEDNLKLVTLEEWNSYTSIENYLGNKLRAGLIGKGEAQRLIREFKDGKIQASDIIK